MGGGSAVGYRSAISAEQLAAEVVRGVAERAFAGDAQAVLLAEAFDADCYLVTARSSLVICHWSVVGDRGQERGAWSGEHGAGSLERGARSLERGARSGEHGVRSAQPAAPCSRPSARTDSRSVPRWVRAA